MENYNDQARFATFRRTNINIEKGIYSDRYKGGDISMREFDNFIINGGFNKHSFIPIFEKLRGTDNEDIQLNIESNDIPMILISGYTNNFRGDESIEYHTGYTGISINLEDNLDRLGNKEQYQKLRAALINDPFKFIFRLFKSPSGKDVQIIVKTSTSSAKHSDIYDGLIDYYKKKYGLKIDEKYKRISEPWLLSYDKDMYKNDDALPFNPRRNNQNPHKLIENHNSHSSNSNNETGVSAQPAIQNKIRRPTFDPNAVPQIFDFLKLFFSPPHQILLLDLLETGRDSDEPLYFLGCGNRLADAFKQLINTDFISGCEKQELEIWILHNFIYRSCGIEKAYTQRYLEDIISTRKDKCANPIFNVMRDSASGHYLIKKI